VSQLRRFRPVVETLEGRTVPTVIVPPSELGTLAGLVYSDCDRGGSFTPGEAGIKGVNLTLTGDNGLTLLATTDAGGAYAFRDLPTGTYTITESQPTGFAQGTNTPGTLSGVVDGDAITGIVVAGTTGTGYNFGEFVTPSALSLSMTKTADRATCAPGDTITYTYTVTNNSPVPLRNVAIRDDNATPNVASDDFTVGTVDSLASGESASFTATRVAPTPPAGSTRLDLTNVATVSGTACGVPAVATASATVTVTTPPPTTPLAHGDTATIGFWQNKNGQALIKSLNGGPTSTALATWLATNFPNLYGANAGASNLTGKTNTDVAALFMQDFSVRGMKTDAQILGAALAVYVTDSDLSGTAGTKYGFNVSSSGTGAKLYNVGSNGSEIGLQDNQSYTVFALLKQADLQKGLGTFDANAFNSIFDGINQLGDRL
jgi:hypothetical protein